MNVNFNINWQIAQSAVYEIDVNFNMNCRIAQSAAYESESIFKVIGIGTFGNEIIDNLLFGNLLEDCFCEPITGRKEIKTISHNSVLKEVFSDAALVFIVADASQAADLQAASVLFKRIIELDNPPRLTAIIGKVPYVGNPEDNLCFLSIPHNMPVLKDMMNESGEYIFIPADSSKMILHIIKIFYKVIYEPNIPCICLGDVIEVLSLGGPYCFEVGTASGKERAVKAAREAINANSFLKNGNKASGIFVVVESSENNVALDEMHDAVMEIEKITTDDPCVMVTVRYDEILNDKMRVDILASGINTHT